MKELLEENCNYPQCYVYKYRRTARKKDRVKTFAMWTIFAALIVILESVAMLHASAQDYEGIVIEGPVVDITEESDPVIIGEEAEPTIEEETEPETTEAETSEIIDDHLGEDDFDFDGHSFHRYELPSFYYGDIDFSSMKAYMSYKAVTSKSSPAYAVVHAECTYIDDIGLLRYPRGEEEFTVDSEPDYVVAMGNYYKEKGSAGGRYLIVTDKGNYTVVVGDEKDDRHTDSHHMFSSHKLGACVLEFLVSTGSLHRAIKQSGSVSSAPVDCLQGTIQYIYGITD